MALLSWLKVLIRDQKLYHGAFGKYNRFRRLCLDRSAKTTEEKLRLAKEVLDGPGVNTMEAQANEHYRRRHEYERRAADALPETKANREPTA